MPRTASRGRQGFIFLPREQIIYWKVEIDGQIVTTDVLSSAFTKALCPDVGECFIELINADSTYTNRFQQGQEIKLYIDLFDAVDNSFVPESLPSPVAYYKFNGDSTDSSGNSNGGVDTDITYVPGKINDAASFNKSTSEITVSDVASIQNIFDNGGSVSVWIYALSDGQSETGTIFHKDTLIFSILQSIPVTPGFIKLQFRQPNTGDDGWWRTATAPIPLKKWTFVTLTFNATTLDTPTIYINGASTSLDVAISPTGTRNSDVGFDLIIGDNIFTTFDGLMDDMRFYDTTLTQNEILTIYYKDATTITTVRFKGKIDSLKTNYSDGGAFNLRVEGSHGLYDRVVTNSFDGSVLISDILDTITPSDYTVNFASTSTIKPVINWDNKPYWDCVNDLTKLAGADAYLDESEVVQFFDINSIENLAESCAFNSLLIDSRGLGKQTVTTKNKVTVIGDDGSGLPILSTSEDLTSQASLVGLKESAIFDTKIITTTQADERSAAELNVKVAQEDEGDFQALILPSLEPGEKVWVSDPTSGILDQLRIYALTHAFPDEFTTCVVNESRDTKDLFKKRVENELATQTITNPHGMKSSWNFTFDNDANLATKDTNVIVIDGIIKLDSGTQGVFTSITNIQSSDVTEVDLRVVGNNVTLVDYEISTDGGNNYQTLSLGLNILVNLGKNLVLRGTFQSANAELDSIAILFK